ncbi:Uncharacterised protein [Serratia proteamaculans]|nr:Uncharacterised protein [Serratia proteamaculans]
MLQSIKMIIGRKGLSGNVMINRAGPRPWLHGWSSIILTKSSQYNMVS